MISECIHTCAALHGTHYFFFFLGKRCVLWDSLLFVLTLKQWYILPDQLKLIFGEGNKMKLSLQNI